MSKVRQWNNFYKDYPIHFKESDKEIKCQFEHEGLPYASSINIENTTPTPQLYMAVLLAAVESINKLEK